MGCHQQQIGDVVGLQIDLVSESVMRFNPQQGRIGGPFGLLFKCRINDLAQFDQVIRGRRYTNQRAARHQYSEKGSVVGKSEHIQKHIGTGVRQRHTPIACDKPGAIAAFCRALNGPLGNIKADCVHWHWRSVLNPVEVVAFSAPRVYHSHASIEASHDLCH